MKHSMNIRMNFIRAANSDPRLPQRQQRLLSTLMTFMPFESEEGWAMDTNAIAKAFYRTEDPTAMRNTRRILADLEEAGAIERVYPGARRDRHSNPTFFINWEWVLRPFREASKKGHPDPSTENLDGSPRPSKTGHRDQYPLIRTQKYPEAGSDEPRLRVVQ